MKIQAVIFDLDGTLTEPLLDFTQIRTEMGITDHSKDLLVAISEMPPSQQRRAHQILFEHEQYAAQHSRLNDGAAAVLQKLHQQNLPIGLLTRNTMENVRFVAQTHGLKFDAILDRDSGPAKPDGFGVKKLCSIFQAAPEQTLAVGDFEHDLLAAANAGAIAVLLKTHPKANEFEHYADYSICHLNEIFDIITGIERD